MKKKALVIDDDQTVLEFMEEALIYFDYDTQTAAGTDNIIMLLKTAQPDIVIIDYLLNGVNGGELCKTIKNDGFYSKLPVIIYSAYPKFLQSLGYYNCDFFIEKPFDLSVMMQKVQDLVAVDFWQNAY